MEQKVVLDWRACVALGMVTIGVILAVRMPAEATEAAFNQLVNATSKGVAIAENSSY